MRRIWSLTFAAFLALPLAFGSAPAAAGMDGTVVDKAASAGNFTTLLTAVKAAGLDDVLRADGPFTIFAPTDEAFAKLPAGKLDELLKPENKEQLANILKYHVVASKVMAADIAGKKSTEKTLAGVNLDIDAAGRLGKVEHAAILQPDITASNGVIHAIDTVLIPQ